MVASGPRKSLLELESRGGVQESSQTLGKPAFNAKRREQRLSAFAVYQWVGQFRGQNISSPGRSRNVDPLVKRESGPKTFSRPRRGKASRYACEISMTSSQPPGDYQPQSSGCSVSPAYRSIHVSMPIFALLQTCFHLCVTSNRSNRGRFLIHLRRFVQIQHHARLLSVGVFARPPRIRADAALPFGR